MEYLALQIIDGMPISVRRLTADLTAEQLHRRPAENEWSIIEITGHLIDKTEIWGERLRRIAAEDRPFLPVYDQNAFVRDRRYREQDEEALLQRLTAAGTALCGDLRTLPAQAWSRIGVHEERGQMTLGDACRIYAISLPEHIEQLVATRDIVVREIGPEPAG